VLVGCLLAATITKINHTVVVVLSLSLASPTPVYLSVCIYILIYFFVCITENTTHILYLSTHVMYS